MGEAVQLSLITGYYRCHNCGQDVNETRKERRWHLCPECWEELTAPDEDGGHTAFWRWAFEMEARFPLGGRLRFRPVETLPDVDFTAVGGAGRDRRDPMPFGADAFWPTCECGRERREIKRHSYASVFGRLRAPKCPVCEAKQMVEMVFGHAHLTHPGTDDEEMLDLLYQSHPEAFEAGVLPDFWFELRRNNLEEEK